MPSPSPKAAADSSALTKGERTAQRILDSAEELFAAKGYEATSLREIAKHASIREPGLYHYFRGKEALYQRVLERALTPMAEALQAALESGSAKQLATLPATMTDLLADHPPMAALFQQALQSRNDEPGKKLVDEWLDLLVSRGAQLITGSKGRKSSDPDTAIRIIALFNLTCGYFLSQEVFQRLARGKLTSPDNLERQKQLLNSFARSLLAPVSQ